MDKTTDVASVMRNLHKGSGLRFLSLDSDEDNAKDEVVRKAATVEEILGLPVATQPKPTLKKLITKPTVRLNGKAPMSSTRAVPTGDASDDDSDAEMMHQDPMSVFSPDAFRNPHLPELSEDEDESQTTKSLPPKVIKSLPPKVAKGVKEVKEVTEEEKAAKKLNKEEAKRERERLEAVEKRRVEREEQASMRAQALSVLDGGTVKLGKAFEHFTSRDLACHRARAVPGIVDIMNKRALLADPKWLPPNLERTTDGATICKTDTRVLYKYQENQAFLEAAKKLKAKRLEHAQMYLAFMA